MRLRHDRADSECVVDEDEWPAIVSFFGGDGAGTVIAARWVLTAAHTAANVPRGHRFRRAGREVAVARVLMHPPQERRDLALVETGDAGVPPLRLHTGEDESGVQALLLGRGDFGNGIEGVRGADGRLRCVTNRVSSVDNRWLRFCFDAPPDCTTLEGVCGEGDSGGPALVRVAGQLRIAGVSSWQDHSGPLGTYGCVEHYARVAPAADWIRRVAGVDGESLPA